MLRYKYGFQKGRKQQKKKENTPKRLDPKESEPLTLLSAPVRNFNCFLDCILLNTAKSDHIKIIRTL